MNYQKALHNERELAPNGGWKIFVVPILWLATAFIVIAGVAYASMGAW